MTNVGIIGTESDATGSPLWRVTLWWFLVVFRFPNQSGSVRSPLFDDERIDVEQWQGIRSIQSDHISLTSGVVIVFSKESPCLLGRIWLEKLPLEPKIMSSGLGSGDFFPLSHGGESSKSTASAVAGQGGIWCRYRSTGSAWSAKLGRM